MVTLTGELGLLGGGASGTGRAMPSVPEQSPSGPRAVPEHCLRVSPACRLPCQSASQPEWGSERARQPLVVVVTPCIARP